MALVMILYFGLGMAAVLGLYLKWKHWLGPSFLAVLWLAMGAYFGLIK
jgi:hypothetical protein